LLLQQEGLTENSRVLLLQKILSLAKYSVMRAAEKGGGSKAAALQIAVLQYSARLSRKACRQEFRATAELQSPAIRNGRRAGAIPLR